MSVRRSLCCPHVYLQEYTKHTSKPPTLVSNNYHLKVGSYRRRAFQMSFQVDYNLKKKKKRSKGGMTENVATTKGAGVQTEGYKDFNG